MFLLVPAYPGCPGSKAVKRSLLLLLYIYIVRPYILLTIKKLKHYAALNETAGQLSTRIAVAFVCLQPPTTKKAKTVASGWSWTLLDDATKYVPASVNFPQEAKVTASLPDDATPLDFVKLYFTEQVIDLVVMQTNRYAEQYIASHVLPPHSSINRWHPTDRDDMYMFLGLSVLMGIVYKP